MAEDNTEHLGLDASDYFQTLDRINTTGQRWLQQNQELVDSFVEMGGNLGNLRVQVQDLSQSQERLSAAFRVTDEGIELVSNSIRVQTNALQLHEVAISRTIEALNRQLLVEREIALSQHESTPQEIIGQFVQTGVAEEQLRNRIQLRLQEVLADEQIEHQMDLMNELERARAIETQRINTLHNEQVEQYNTLRTLSQQLTQEERLRANVAQQELQTELRLAAAREDSRVRELHNTQQVQFNNLRTAANDYAQFEREQEAIEENNIRLVEQFYGVGAAGEQAGNGILLSWQTMGRLLVTSAIHQTIYQLIGAFHEGINTAAEFETRISEIRSISQQSQLTFNQWSLSVRDLSNQFGTPILDTAEAAYQALSNQVAQGAATFGFLDTALQFSQVTMSTAKDSVNLLASAINSFSLGVDQSEHIAAVFFNTIAIGRLRAEDLSNIFGRIAPLAHSLGISFEETNAAIATLTVRGIPANEAMTLLNNVFSHLLNPTKEMKELFAELGVSSGETAIATFGLAGTLDKIQQFAHGSSAEIAALEKDIRAIRGALDLTGDSLISFKKNLQSINDTEPFDLAKKISVESAGKKFQIDMNEIKNFFITDFGEAFLGEIEKVGQATDYFGLTTRGIVGAVEGLVNIAKTAIEVFAIYYVGQRAIAIITAGNTLLLGEEAATYTALTGAVGGTEAAMLGLRAAALLNPATLAVVGIAAAVFEYNRLVEAEEAAKSSLITLGDRAEKISNEQNKVFNANIDDENQKVKESLDSRVSDYLKFGADVNRLLSNLAAYDKSVMKEVAQATKDAFKVAVDDIEEGINRLKEDSRNAASEIRDANKEISSILDGLNRSTFEHQLKLLPGPEQVTALFDDINKHTELAATKLREKVGDAGTAKANREEAIKAENQALADQNQLTDTLAKAQEKITKDQEQLAELQKEQAAQSTKSVDVEQLRRLQDLEHQYDAAKRSHNDIYAEQLRHQIDLAKEQTQTDSSDEAGRKLQERIDKLTEELTAQQAIADAIKARGDLETGLAKIQQQQIDNLRAYAAILDGIKKADDAKIEQEKKRLEILEDTLKTIEAIKVPATIKTQDQADQFIKQNFDDPLQKALNAGAVTDSKLVTQLHTERVQLQESLHTQVLENQKKQADEQLIQQKKNIEEALNAESAAIKKANDDRTTLAIKLREELGSRDAADRPIPGKLATAVGENQGISGPVNNFLSGATSKEDFQKSVALFFSEISKAPATTPGDIKNFFDPKDAALLQTAPNQVEQQIEQFIKSTEDLKKAQDALAVSQTALHAANLAGNRGTPNDTAAAERENTAKIQDSISAIQQLQKSITDLNTTLTTRGVPNLPNAHPDSGTTPQSTNFNPTALPSINNSAPNTTFSDSTSIGAITVNITSPGPVNAETIRDSINDSIRRGTFKIRTSDSALTGTG